MLASGETDLMIGLASRQIWPHVIAVANQRPKHLVLVHSSDLEESKRPAQRLKKLLLGSDLMPKGSISMVDVPHDDFASMQSVLSDTVKQCGPATHILVNVTGGNKLMATAAWHWCHAHRIPAFYVERSGQAICFDFHDGDISTRTISLDLHATDLLSPVSLLRAQLSASDVEREGEALHLSEAGARMSTEAFLAAAVHPDRCQRDLLVITGTTDAETSKGDQLEYRTAACLLKLGVPSITRSLRLKVRTLQGVPSRHPHAELDLIFNWGGRLWLVDCKDRDKVEDLTAKLVLAPAARNDQILKVIRSQLAISHTKVMKEDLIAMREMGGLLGRIVCIRKSKLPDEITSYAERNRISLIYSSDLHAGLQAVLTG